MRYCEETSSADSIPSSGYANTGMRAVTASGNASVTQYAPITITMKAQEAS